MFYSQCLLSRKGRLGSIWVAAYCFKKLKKAQVAETDISASVDKILKDDWDVIAYRVLAYLLLGVVRIYSKKVEYLFDDCHEVLTEINKFVVSTKEKGGTDTFRAPYDSVTLPERFELDAFDLGLPEDVSGGNVVSYEAITLKDCPKGNVGQFSSDMYDYEEFGACRGIFSANYIPGRDVLSFNGMELDMELRTSRNGANPEVNMENPQESRFSQVETNGEQIKVPDIALSENGTLGEARQEKLPDLRSEENGLNHETFFGIEEEPLNQVEPFGEDHETNGEQIKAPAVVQSVDGIQEEASLEPSCHVTSSGEDHHIIQEEIIMQSENQMCPVTREDHNLSNLEADRGNLKSCTPAQEENMDLDKSCDLKKPQKPVCSYGEENHKDGEPTKLQDTIPPDNVNCQITDGKDSEALVVTTPKLRRVIPTPAMRKAAQISRKRKRKCTFDEMVVLPNTVIKQSINDASDLVSKRRKVPETALAAWKTCQLRNLSRNFLEPLIPSVSEELRSLFHKSIIESAETVEPPEKLDVLEPPSTGRPEQVEIAPGPPVLEQIEIEPGTPILEKIEIAPGTPVLHSTSMKSFNSPKSPEAPDMDMVIPEPSGRIEEEPSMGNEQAYPSESVEVPSLDKVQEHDFNLLNEEPDLCEGVNPELDGWSKRTRVVARYLHREFTNCKNRGEEEVNLLQVSEGKTKKESARLFYETLVLRTNGYVDVKQDEAYGDILLRKLHKWGQTWEDDMVNRDSFEPMDSCA
ncbi:sister chromatid cohesion 1 protein 2-like [Rosa rugosa]|uniref:sister chromatid cohesion 1 protein 2-like n=1 Tax=Rosa rugosa TaxID=74645 RepID=UPI002B407B4A|nr:sister chromatid cohesion 1 protein 2-like [Rosa rugosa]